MIRRFVAVVALCGFIAGCHTREDTKRPEGWGTRPLEARLTAYPQWRAVQQLPPRPAAHRNCDPEHATAGEAVKLLVEQPLCTDEAISLLEQSARNDAQALSDLGAAFYSRGNPADYLASLQASEQALVAMPDLEAARFNRALALEKLGLTDEAVRAWDAVGTSSREPGWQSEAHAHRERLVSASVFNAEADWKNKVRPALLQAQSVEAIEASVRLFPSLAENVLFDEVLPQWAAAPSPERLATARMLAAALGNVTGDRYAVEVVAACKPEDAAIRKALVQFGNARVNTFDFAVQQRLYASAQSLLAGHPFRLHARVREAVAISFNRDTGPADAVKLLNELEQEARAYPYLLALIHFSQGYCLYTASQYAEAIKAYRSALEEYQRIDDRQSLVRIQSRMAGTYNTAGQTEKAWSWALQALDSLKTCADRKTRIVALGEAADAAASLGYPKYALAYQERAIAEQPGSQPGLIGSMKRAALHLALDRLADARADLANAERLLPTTQADPANRRALTTRLLELQGRAETNPRAALARFNDAYRMTGSDELNTFRASLLAQMADAHDRLGETELATNARLAALGELRAEQKKNLATRKPGESEDLWSAYFARFRSMVEKLIRRYARTDPAMAFTQAEQARAAEPLNLLLQRSSVPESFRAMTRGGGNADLAAIRGKLAPDTFLIEYAVFENDAFVWIVSRDHDVQFRILPVRRASIERWSLGLQENALHHQTDRFRTILQASYDALLREPLEIVRTMNPTPARLVFIPDGPMHGLPFAALYDTDAKQYLTEVAPIEIAPSATLYVHSLDRDRDWAQAGAQRVLLVGDPAFDRSRPEALQMDRLRGALAEVEQIREVYGNRPVLLKEENATVERFLQNAQNSTVVHFAGHAVPDRDAPQHSYLLLAPSGNDDGVLDAQELLTQLSLDRTRLVVLSACSSAGGAPVGPEGVSPLVRPLITAGVPAVIGSLWDVDDATAVTPLVSFHRHYEQGEDAAVAMQHMQLEMLRKDTPQWPSILAWAPFQVIGHASSPFRPAPQSKEISNDHVSGTHSVQRSDGVRSQ